MKILLISPYPSLVSYGIRMLSACLKQGGHESAILFMPDTDDRGLVNCDQSAIDQIVELARGKDLIGISLTSNYFLVIKDLCNKLRRKLNIPIVLGGVHPTVSYGDCLDFSDYIFRGESELAFCDFVTNFNSENPRPLSQIDNLIYKEGNKIFINSIKNPSDLDRLPFPDYDGGHFIIVRNKKAVLSHKILQLFLKGSYMTFPTRGCPFKCAYCCNNSYHELYKNNKIFRYRSVPNLINELIWCKEKIDIDSLIFDDDAFLALNDLYLKEFVELFKNKINLPLAITSVNPQMAASVEGKLDILRSLNITFMRMGIQSGSEDIRKNVYFRGDSNDDIIRTSKALVDRGINYAIDVILNNPFEKDEDLVETILLITKLKKIYSLTAFSLAFYPGTYLYNRAVKEKLIKDKWSEVIKTRFGHYGNQNLTPMNKLISCSPMLSENMAKFILSLRKTNLCLFIIVVNCITKLYKIRIVILKIKRILIIIKREGCRRLFNRFTLSLKQAVWLRSLS